MVKKLHLATSSILVYVRCETKIPIGNIKKGPRKWGTNFLSSFYWSYTLFQPIYMCCYQVQFMQW